MLVYSLTGLTGSRKNEGRQMVVMTFEVRRHTLLVSLIGALAGMVIAAPFFALFGMWALVIIPVAVAAANMLFASRQTKGLQVYRYRSLLNSRNAHEGFWINGQPFATPEFIMHTPAVVEVWQVDSDHASVRDGDTSPSFARGVRGNQARDRVSVRERRA